jgi:phenylalanine-4-hydroxylase
MELPTAPTRWPAQLRGDYAAARADYSVEQDPCRYTDVEHDLWAQLLARQRALLPRYAAPEFMAGLKSLALTDRIPSFEQASKVLYRATRWQLIGVPGLIPEKEFFEHLSQRRFPVTVWLRSPEEIDYLAEPDLFHDFFGHVPMLLDPAYADFMELYGRAGERAMQLGGLKMLARLYWYGVEFGLIETDAGLRTYGAGILSSFGETRHAIESPEPQRLRFDLERVLRTDYLIDDYQRSYFVIRSFRELMDAAVNTDFAPLYERYGGQAGIDPGALVPGDETFPAPLRAEASLQLSKRR